MSKKKDCTNCGWAEWKVKGNRRKFEGRGE